MYFFTKWGWVIYFIELRSRTHYLWWWWKDEFDKDESQPLERLCSFTSLPPLCMFVDFFPVFKGLWKAT